MRGIFWSFILWTSAEAEPSRAEAVTKRAAFMMDTESIDRRQMPIELLLMLGYIDRVVPQNGERDRGG